MELPTELVNLIREYSQPCFKYFREYNRMMRLMGFTYEWKELKKSLRERPDQVLPRLLSFEKAQLAWLQVAGRPPTLYEKSYWFCGNKYSPEQWYQCKLAIRTREWKEFTKVVNR
jgi:hypothetical protein